MDTTAKKVTVESVTDSISGAITEAGNIVKDVIDTVSEKAKNRSRTKKTDQPKG